MKILLKILLTLAGPLITQFILPLLRPKVKPLLEILLPRAEHWVAAVETSRLPGIEKYNEAFRAIESEFKATNPELLTDQVIKSLEGTIDTAIQLAWMKLGLDQK